MSTPVADLDSPWKDAIEEYLPDCFALLFPTIGAAIDWRHPPEFLENELRQVVGESELGPRRVDLLVRVRLRDGRQAWLLVHIEVQGQEDAAFAQRMFVYYYRLFDRYAQPVVSLAVLTDARARWRPTTFALEQWGCALHFSYPVVKLTDWRGREGELEASENRRPGPSGGAGHAARHGEPAARQVGLGAPALRAGAGAGAGVKPAPLHRLAAQPTQRIRDRGTTGNQKLGGGTADAVCDKF